MPDLKPIPRRRPDRNLAPQSRRRFSSASRHPRNAGMTLIELLTASAILLMMTGAMAALAMNVQQGATTNAQRSLSLQHGQVALQRMQRAILGATANREFPGFVIVSESVGGHSFPDNLVVWRPAGPPSNPDGLPKMNELVIYCANPQQPSELWELTAPLDTRDAPRPNQTSAWRTEVRNLKASNTTQRLVISDLLRIAQPRDGTGNLVPPRAVMRFEPVLRPSAAEWNDYVAGTRAWGDLSWVQGIYGPSTGLRQHLCHIELQLRPGDVEDHRRDVTIPFFGSGALLYEVDKP